MTTDDVTRAIDDLVEPFTWTATIQRGEKSLELVVEGTATAPTTGWSAELTRVEPQGVNEKILMLRLSIQRPLESEIVLDKLTPLPASYSEAVQSESQFTHVDVVGVDTFPVNTDRRTTSENG